MHPLHTPQQGPWSPEATRAACAWSPSPLLLPCAGAAPAASQGFPQCVRRRGPKSRRHGVSVREAPTPAGACRLVAPSAALPA